jgi:transitional endoplasmic reticulum ATPase
MVLSSASPTAYREDVGLFENFQRHSLAPRTSTDVLVHTCLRHKYPDHIITDISSTFCNLKGYAKQGYANLTLIRDAEYIGGQRTYLLPGTRGVTEGTILESSPIYAKYDLEWQGHKFPLFCVETSKHFEQTSFAAYALSKPSDDKTPYDTCDIIDKMLMEIAIWADKLEDELWVFDDGYWYKNSDLFETVKSSSWDDVILDPGTKNALTNDILGFYKSKDKYKRFGVPWKRGIILHGVPGCGKTITIKAVMNSLNETSQRIPTLYVKSFVSGNGPQQAIRDIFRRARETAPCFLVIEDLDSMVTDEVRSYFLNEVDGLDSNDGILILGSTNHLDKLDPAIVKRPSRFDRKYAFRPPILEERVLYAKYWRKKIESIPEVSMMEEDLARCAAVTDGFTFAYLKEAFVATLFALFQKHDDAQEAAAKGEAVEAVDADPSGKSDFVLAFEKEVQYLKDQMVEKEDEEEEDTVFVKVGKISKKPKKEDAEGNTQNGKEDIEDSESDSAGKKDVVVV